MEANNHFNYGSHSSVSANSGLKLSSGDSHYTNGSSMSFPQQGKNINGDMNVNGITTAIGTSQAGSTSSYPHMSNHHHQDGMAPHYMWGQQYNPALSSGSQHFQGHGQYQVNGGMGASRQAPVAGAANASMSAGQYWNRGNPSQHQGSTSMPMGYNSHSMYGAYQSQVHTGMPPAGPQHHQQPSMQHQSAGSVSSQSLSTHQKASSESSSASGSPVASSLSPTGARKLSHGTPPSMSVQPPRLSSPPLMVQGLRSAPGPVPPSTMAGPAQLMAASPPSGPSQTGHITMPVTVPVTLPSALSVAGSSTSPQSTSSLSVPLKNLPPSLSPSFHSHLSSLSSLVQGPKPPEVSKPVMSAPPSEVCAPPAPALKDFPPSPKAQVLPHSAACSPQKAPDTVSVPTPASPPASGHLPSDWRREVRVKTHEDRMKGETWYYSPCGRRMKQFPEVIKYLRRHQCGEVTREHFSFSPRMPVGDFYEERDSPEGMKWFLLANEEVPSMIMAITGRRGRPPNPDKEKTRPRVRREKGAPGRRPGRPPKSDMTELLSKVDARLLKRLEAKEVLTEEDKEKLMKIKKKLKRKRSKAKALARAQAEAEAQAQAVLAAKRQAERRAQAQKRLEERKRQQLILEEMKKPAEDMCLCDHQPLPELSRIAGVVLTGRAFSNCLIVVEFLHSYGKVLGLQVPKDVPSLSTLQEGILGVGSSQGEVLDLLIKLVDAALHDPGLPSYYQSVKILGEKLVDVELSHVTVSEALRIFLESNGFEMEVCKSLHIKNFQSLCPEVKASILAFLVEMLNASNTVIRDVDNTLENMATYRKNKWILEGKLRKLKAALVKRTGRSEEELCLEDRRRSTRGGMAEEESLEDIIPLERGSRRSRREETNPTTASIAELERQIDKLTKRQVFFRKKLQQSSHSLRAISLGQDRYRRRYWVLPHVGGILVEGPEEILGCSDPNISVKKETPLSPVTPVSNRAAATTTFHPSPPLLCSTSPSELDSLPGEASLMSSSPRGRGRPRKIKPEVELHLRAAKNRRRRRSSKSGGDEPVPGAAANGSMPDLTQSTFVSWLSQSQASVTNGAATNGPEAGGPDESAQSEDMLKETALLLPKIPCNAAPSLSEPSGPTSPPVLQCMVPIAPVLPSVVAAPPLCSTPVQKPTRRRRRGSSPGRRTYSRSSAARRRGRPAAVVFQEIEQKFFTQLVVKPIPLEMVKGWWWVKEPAQLTALVQALHPRGARERVLHKHLTKHMEYLSELCAKPVYDPVFQQKVEEGSALLEALHQPWPELQNAIQADVTALQWVEDLEQRVLTADLQLKVYTLPEPDSTRQDLEFYEHEVDPRDDWIVKTKKEWSDMLRIPNNPLDLAVLRLANLERNIERRYLKEPLWNLSEVVRLAPLTPPHGEEAQMDVGRCTEITPRLRTWRQALDRCRSAAQLSLCLLQLERAIAWERSIVKVTCQICHKGDNDEYLLLCDGCDRGCHMFCLRPKVTQVPEGDWFCPTCVSAGDDSRPHRTARQRACGRKRRAGLYDSSEEDDCPRRSGGMSTRQKDGPSSSSSSGCSPSKRRRMTTRNQPDLTYCEIILMEMEAHADAWPFLEPVNPRLVPGYRRIIKNPMDFLTMRERLLQGGYCSCEEFAADAQLVFNNCELFNEDTSEVGMAGHSMRRFFESRWAEFYQTKDK
uniref:Bromodomain adjacent to zinc finger domain protein 2A n=1 Tax=Denticeps clupeoides TaxID=299321 RepID=A0AAY4CYT1_9TELE